MAAVPHHANTSHFDFYTSETKPPAFE